MKLIVILVCLGLERYLHIGDLLKRSNLIQQYAKQIDGLTKDLNLPTVWLNFALFALPLWLTVMLLLWFFGGWVFGLFTLIIHVLVLSLCLGPDDLYHQVKNYFTLVKKNEMDKASEQLATIVEEPLPESSNGQARALTDAICVQANERFFAVIFWYVMPFGLYLTLLYRITVAVSRYARNNDLSTELQLVNDTAHDVLDWLPARLSALCYALAGNFSQTFTAWLQALTAQLDQSKALLQNCGRLALGLSDDDNQSDLNENRFALELIDRVLVVYLALIAVFTLGSFM